MTVAPNSDAQAARPWACPSKRQASITLAALFAIGLLLRLWELSFGLPFVLHSDHAQVEQAAELLRTGGFAERAPYPTLNVLILAALDAAVGWLGAWSGRASWSDWAGFLESLSRPELAHLVARGWSAAAGALLAPAVYLLARVALSRGPALLAAAAATLCPIAVAVSHQARIHAPGVTLLVFAAVPALRFIASPALPRALVAGAATGVAGAFFQLGLLLAAATLLQAAITVRPWGRALRLSAAYALAVGAVVLLIDGVGHVVADIRPGHDGLPVDSPFSLRIPAVTLGLHFERLPRLAATWVASEPVRALLVLLCVALALAGRVARRPLLLYGTYPLLLLAVLGSNYTQARYVLSVTPFLAPLAVLGLQGLRPRPLSVACAVLLVASPLIASIRFDLLLAAGDTRLKLASSLACLPEAGGTVLVEDRLLPRRASAPPWVRRFPENGDFQPWTRGETTREVSFAAARPVIFLREPAAELCLDDQILTCSGLQLAGCLDAGSMGHSDFPDPTKAMALDVWRARCSGPDVEIWALPGGPTRVALQLVER